MEIHAYATLKPSLILHPFTYKAPTLNPFEILIKVSHSGLCHTDLYMMENAWNRSTYPLVPGHEVVGTVVAAGSASEKKMGERIALSWTRSSCLQCPQCLQGDTNVCPTKTSLYNKGFFGGFADYVIGDSRFAYHVPKELDGAHAAPLLCAGATVYTPLRHLKNRHVAILGIGGLGHLALQFAKTLGNEVSALSSTASKEKEAYQFGADHFYTLDALPQTQLFDFLLCTSDANLDWNAMLRLLRPNGVLCFVSRPLKGLSIDPKDFISSQRTICGSNNANRAVMNEMLAFCATHQIKPQIEILPLKEINQGIEKLRKNEVRYRIVFEIK